jgi:hypothetical protein
MKQWQERATAASTRGLEGAWSTCLGLRFAASSTERAGPRCHFSDLSLQQAYPLYVLYNECIGASVTCTFLLRLSPDLGSLSCEQILSFLNGWRGKAPELSQVSQLAEKHAQETSPTLMRIMHQ